MKPGEALGLLCCLGTILFLILGFEVAIFRVACSLCRVPQPGLVRTTGIVAVLLLVPAVVDAIVGAILTEAYLAGNYPLWEAGLVEFFIALPVHMAICSTIHAQMVRIPMTHGLSVWLVEKLLKLMMLAAIVGVIALVILARQAK